jgi:hypothetical protein
MYWKAQSGARRTPIMAIIPFTEYRLPHGRRFETGIDCPDDVAASAQQVIDAGHRFECEILRTGQVSLTVFNLEDEEDVAIRVVPNGPGIKEAVASLVAEAARTTTPAA